MTRLFLFNKPYGALSQFSGGSGGRDSLASFIDAPGVHPAGRLDMEQAKRGAFALRRGGRKRARMSDCPCPVQAHRGRKLCGGSGLRRRRFR